MIILLDNGTQFQSPLWKGTMQKYDVKARYSAIRHPQKAIQVKEARKKFRSFAGFIVIQTTESGRNNSAHRILAKQHRFKLHFIYTS
jgi:hypothetical protein